MNSALLNQIVKSVLYEGYLLYPYRSSSIKNQRERFTFGRVYPLAYATAQNGAEPCLMRTECLVECPRGGMELQIKVCFLQPAWREIGELSEPLSNWSARYKPKFNSVPELTIAGCAHRPGHEAIEREISLPPLRDGSGVQTHRFEFPLSSALKPIHGEGGRIEGLTIRTTQPLNGSVVVHFRPIDPDSGLPRSSFWVAGSSFQKLSVEIANLSPMGADEIADPSVALLRTFVSTHTILHSSRGSFVSMTDPPAELTSAVASCKNLGTWPVLVGDEGKRECDTMLSSPIILYDYPKIAPESCGDLFDSTEIDEILSLRILTLSDDEKREMRNVDSVARRLLERTEGMGKEEFLKLHGTMREATAMDETFFGNSNPIDGVTVQNAYLKSGSRVRIRPKGRSDIMDLALTGRIAVIEAVEQDAEKRIHLALVLEDDPGRDLGMLRQPGHRFFFGPEEVELVREKTA